MPRLAGTSPHGGLSWRLSNRVFVWMSAISQLSKQILLSPPPRPNPLSTYWTIPRSAHPLWCRLTLLKILTQLVLSSLYSQMANKRQICTRPGTMTLWHSAGGNAGKPRWKRRLGNCYCLSCYLCTKSTPCSQRLGLQSYQRTEDTDKGLSFFDILGYLDSISMPFVLTSHDWRSIGKTILSMTQFAVWLTGYHVLLRWECCETEICLLSLS